MSTSNSNTPDIPVLIWLGIRPILKLIIISSAGVYLARKGIINPTGLQLFSKTLFSVLYPCLLFSKIASAISAENIANAGSLLATSSFFLLFGLLGGLLIRWMVGKDSHNFKGGIISACVWGNWGDLMFAMIFSLGNSPPFQPGDALVGVAYLSFLLLTWNISFFPMGGTRLIENDFKKPSSKADMEAEPSAFALNDLRDVVLSSHVVDVGLRSENGTSRSQEFQEATLSEHAAIETEEHQTPPYTTSSRFIEGESNISHIQPETYDNPSLLPESLNEYTTRDISLRQKVTFFGKFKNCLITFLTAPNIALLAGLVVGVTPPLKGLFVQKESESNGVPPLQFIMECADFVGAAAVPLALINLGAALSRLKVDVVRPLTVSLIAIFRLVVCPIVAIGGTQILVHYDVIDRKDKMLQFIIMFQGCTPSATSNVFITQLYNNGEAGAMAAVLLAQYTIGTVSMIISLIVILMLLF